VGILQICQCFSTRIPAVRNPKNMMLLKPCTTLNLITCFRATTNHIATTDNLEFSVKPWSCSVGSMSCTPH
jgi:hypothetical protein